jgi:2-haloacid dehalogenase
MSRPFVLAFDIYGTLIDPLSTEAHLAQFFGEQAQAAAQLWRAKQLEYAMRRGLMQKYMDFDACTAQALLFVSRKLGVDLSDETRGGLLDQYRRLPAYPDVAGALAVLARDGHTLLAFSNGTGSAVRGLLQHAGVLHHFRDVVSVDAVKTFKPAPAVYEHLLASAGVSAESIWLVSSNPFDVIGAKACGLRAAWIRRDPRAVFDPWEYSPDVMVPTLADLPAKLG